MHMLLATFLWMLIIDFFSEDLKLYIMQLNK